MVILRLLLMAADRPLALVIEDDPASAEALALILRDWGADVAHSRDAAGVAAAIGQRRDALRWIITDFHLGAGPDGVTLVKDLAQSSPGARVLVLSGSFHGRAVDAAELAGFEVMNKPARADAIIQWLERA